MINLWRDRVPSLATVRDSLAIVALLLGGAWALFTFVTTDQIERARLQTQQLAQHSWPVINVQLQAEHWRTQQAGDTIWVEVTLENEGHFKEILDLTQPPFRVYPVQFAPTNTSGQRGQLPVRTKSWHKAGADFPVKINKVQLLPDEKERLVWLYQVPEPHLYYIEFRVSLIRSQASQASWQDTGVTLHQPSWSAGAFVEVPPKTLSGQGLPGASAAMDGRSRAPTDGCMATPGESCSG